MFKWFWTTISLGAPDKTALKAMDYDQGIRASIKVKNRLYLIGDLDMYKYYRKKLCSLARLSKK